MPSFQPPQEMESVEVSIGTDLKLSGAFKGWTLWHLDNNGKKKYGTTKDWRVTAGGAHIRKVNRENAGTGLAELKENFRLVFDTKQEALEFIAKYTPQTLLSKLGNLIIPPWLLPQIATSVAMIVGNTSPKTKNFSLVSATEREIKRLDRVQKTVKELVILRTGIDLTNELRHLQYANGTNIRDRARVYFELVDFMGDKMVYDVTPEDARAFLDNVRARRLKENSLQKDKKLGPGTLIKLFRSTNAMFKYAVSKHWCDENPFEELWDGNFIQRGPSIIKRRRQIASRTTSSYSKPLSAQLGMIIS